MNRPLLARLRLDPRAWRCTTRAWWVLVLLSLASVAAAGGARAGGSHRLFTVLVAVLAALKAGVLVRHFLEAHRAGPIFHTLFRVFMALVPLGLMVCAWREAGG